MFLEELAKQIWLRDWWRKRRGIILTNDSPYITTREDPNDYLVHDEDLLKLVNELWAAGAKQSVSMETGWWPIPKSAAPVPRSC